MKIPANAFTTDIQLRFVDTDMAGHVNHAVYVTYMEAARVEWIRSLGKDTELAGIPIIIARVEVDYLKPIHLQHTPKVSVWTKKVGTKSFTFSYAIHDEVDGEQVLFATGETVQVYFDYKNQVSKVIPDHERQLIESYLPQ